MINDGQGNSLRRKKWGSADAGLTMVILQGKETCKGKIKCGGKTDFKPDIGKKRFVICLMNVCLFVLTNIARAFIGRFLGQ